MLLVIKLNFLLCKNKLSISYQNILPSKSNATIIRFSRLKYKKVEHTIPADPNPMTTDAIYNRLDRSLLTHFDTKYKLIINNL